MRLKTPLALAALTSVIAGCGGGDDAFAPQAITADDCRAMAGRALPATEIAVPSAGAVVGTATFVLSSDAGNANGTFCKIVGTMPPQDPAAPAINYEVNLPANWNGRMVQYGGGGFDGTLVTGLALLDFAPPATPTPLAQNYMTLGDDSGHVGTVTDGKFAVNDEALANYGRLSLRKTHDVAVALMKRLYGVSRAQKSYFIGSSTGGRDAFSAIQQWPEEYDAIFVNRPAHNYTGLRLSNIQLGRSLFLNGGAGWIDPAKTTLLLGAVMAACDTLDGVQDGIINNLPACKAKGDATLAALRCAGGADTGDTCLSDAQIATVRTMAGPLKLNYPLANGIAQYGGYNILAGMVFGPPYSTSRNFGPSKTGPAAPNYLAVGSGTGANAPKRLRHGRPVDEVLHHARRVVQQRHGGPRQSGHVD